MDTSDYASLLEILKQLVSFETVADNHGQVNACYKYIETRLAGLPVHVERYESNGFQSLVMTSRPTKQPKVLLQAHIDVVPAYKSQFNLTQHENILFGRGVYDMKFAAACYIRLLEDFGRDLGRYDIGLMLTADEEVGGLNGVNYLLDQGYNADVCILPDSGDDWNIEASAKGFAVAEIVAKGKSAHGSRPWEADNAAGKLIKFLSAIEREFSFADKLAATCTLTRLDAGPAYNQIPGEATATFDIRYPDEKSLKFIQQKLRRMCQKYGMAVGFTVVAAAVHHDISSPHTEAWKEITEQITGMTPGYTASFGASDARYMVPHGITVISARPKGGGHHGSEEWISEKDFYEFYEVIKNFVVQAAA